MMTDGPPPSYQQPSINNANYGQGSYVNEKYDFVNSNEGILSPPTAPPYEPPQQERQPVINLGSLSEDELRDACIQYASEHCCYGKRFVRDAEFPTINNICAFHYKLETYGEKRRTVDTSTSFFGQSIDGPENGPPPDPWSMVVQPPPLFQDSTMKVEVPHTAYVKDCYRCVGNCRIRCESCYGRGGSSCSFCFSSGRNQGQSCTSCNGTGRQVCWSCNGTGQVKCTTCHGHGKLKHYKLLIVTWTNHIENFVSETYNLPKELILNVSGREMLKEQYPQVTPLNHVEDESVNAASKMLVQKHRMTFSSELIRMQRHTLWAVPVTKATFVWKNKCGEFFVYGFQKKVYFKNYPQKCCCCTLL